MRQSWFEPLLGFLAGVAWALALAGGLYASLVFQAFGFLLALVAFFFGVLPGLLLVVGLEFIQRLLQLKAREVELLESLERHAQASVLQDRDEALSHH